jgi:broad specificity phosphatase PhoE
MTIFHLVRHASHDLIGRVLAGRKVDISLNAEGCRQAETIAQQLAAQPVRQVISSPQLRARQTAEPIAVPHRLSIGIASEIDEHHAGLWEGQEFETLQRDPHWRLWNEQRAQTRPPAGESMRELQVRVISYLDRLTRQCPHATIVLVSHAEPIRAALLHERGVPLPTGCRWMSRSRR